MTETAALKTKNKTRSAAVRAAKNWQLYLMYLPGLLVLAVFCYYPMYGLILSFKDYNPVLGITASHWIGFENFKYAVLSRGFANLVKNTLILGVLKLIFAFPCSIILALLMNELGNKVFKKSVQTISYLPYFISWVIVASIAYMFLSTDYGILNSFLKSIGLPTVQWYAAPQYWRAIIIITGIWKTTGWGTIIFLAGLTAINPDLYEAARCDGAGRWSQTWHVSVPGIMPVIMMTLILSIAGIVRDDFEQIYALVGINSNLNPTMDVLGTWMYRGLQSAGSNFRAYGEITAVGFVQGIISFILMIGANYVTKKTENQGLW